MSLGRAVVVTGAASGIGAAVGRRFAAQGDHVIMVDHAPGVKETAAAIGDRATAIRLDVRDPAAWESALRRYRGPPVRGLVACAGVLGPAAPVHEVSVEEFRRIVDVNLTGVFVSNRAVLPRLLEAGGGRIVNIASIAGKEGNAEQAAYSASKGGVIAFTKALAREVAAQGITVNCLAPTVVEGRFAETMSEEMRGAIRARIPMGRFVATDEVAAMVAWICSDECSFTTGFCFDLTGGRSTY